METLYDKDGNTNYLHIPDKEPAKRYDGAGNNNYLFIEESNDDEYWSMYHDGADFEA